MITLISRWKLRNGCPPELAAALREVASQVQAAEPDTWMYSVHLPSPSPLDDRRQPAPAVPIDASSQTEVVFFEIYKDAAAFSRHVNGPTFTRFRLENAAHFEEDPAHPGWPRTETTFLDRLSAFVGDGAR